jgi:hypothetical protein
VEFVKFLPDDPRMRILGSPNRWLFVTGWSCFAVFVEVLLKRAGIFHWEYWLWNQPIFGYGTFFAMAAWVYDMETHRRRFTVIGLLVGVNTVLAVGLGLAGWP